MQGYLMVPKSFMLEGFKIDPSPGRVNVNYNGVYFFQDINLVSKRTRDFGIEKDILLTIECDHAEQCFRPENFKTLSFRVIAQQDLLDVSFWNTLKTDVIADLAFQGDARMIKYLIANGFKLSAGACLQAAKGGHIDVLKLFKEAFTVETLRLALIHNGDEIPALYLLKQLKQADKECYRIADIKRFKTVARKIQTLIV